MAGDSWTLKQTLSVLLFITVSMVIAGFLVTFEEPPGDRLGTIVFVVLFGVFIFLNIRFKGVHEIFLKGAASYLMFCGVMVACVMPMVVIKWVSDFLLDSAPWPVQVGALALWALLLGGAIWLITTKERRDGLLSELARRHVALPAAYGVFVLLLALLFFSTASVLMAGRGWLTFVATSSVPVSAGALTDFYLWHFVNAVPVLKITETLKWSAPLQYESAGVGWILLLFKFTVIGPLIAAFAWYGKRPTPAADRPTDWPFLYRPAPRA